ncbi:MAG: DUF2807 domain-containing protein [Alistipes sp.]|nr:DUF2807 domain-containing protein [Alistipes sp.]
MRRALFLALAFVSFTALAQSNIVERPDSLTTVVRNISAPKTEWLSPFNKVVVDGYINVVFKHVDTDEGLKIVYDTKGSLTSRFRTGVDKNGVLQIIERADSKQLTMPTEVTVWYKNLDNISVARATATFEGVVESKLLDITVKAGAVVVMNINTLDAMVNCTGKSRLKIGGQSRYFDVDISTAKMDGLALQTVASNIDASHEAEVRIAVSERLEAVTATAAKLYYKGRPTILRNKNSLFGGEILAIE